MNTVENIRKPNKLIPGVKIKENCSDVAIKPYKEDVLNFDSESSKKIFSNLFAPLTEAIYFEDVTTVTTSTNLEKKTVVTNKSKLKVLLAPVVGTSKGLTHDKFSFYYHFSYSSRGDYQLNFYITFDEASKAISEVNSYTSFPFEISLSEDVVKSANGISVPLKSIKSVQAFLIDVDPETTRGTETTVQDTTG